MTQDDEIIKLNRRVKREIKARKAAEGILEKKALELYDANENLRNLNKELEKKIKNRTQELQAKEARFRSLIETATDVIFNSYETGVFTYMNPTGLQVYGYDYEEVIGQHFLEFIFPPDREMAYDHFMDFLENDLLESYFEFRVCKKSGSIIWIGQKTRKLYINNELTFTAVARDITDIKQSEQNLIKAREAFKKSELKYRSMIEKMQIGIVEVNLKGQIMRAYEQFCKMFLHEEQDILTIDIDTLLIGKAHQKTIFHKPSLDRSIAQEIIVNRKNGENIWVNYSSAPIYNEFDELGGYVLTFYDINDQKILQSELHNAKETAEKAQQAEKHFLASMSHEIRTPLNAIVGMTHLMKETQLNPDQIEYVDILSHSANVLLGLISDILDISKIDAGKTSLQERQINLKLLIDGLCRTFTTNLKEKGVALKQYFDPEINTLLISDQNILNQILINLLGNASKFTSEGSVQINVIQQQKYNGKRKILFEVIDTGIGISPDKHRTIFEQFKQANSEIINEFGGTGLGLNITKKLVSLLGGTIQIESDLGKGSKFYFSTIMNDTGIPMEDYGQAIDKERKINIKSDVEILIVEDNIMNQKYICSLLDKWHMSYHVAPNGAKAIDICQDHKFDLIFMDLQMPLMDGVTATELILRDCINNKETPIIALTASSFMSKKESAMQAGMSDFLSKPFTPDQLMGAIEKNLPMKTITTEIKESIFRFSDQLDISFLEEVYGDDMEYAFDIFQIFIETFDEEYKLLLNAIDGKDKNDIKSVVHKMKPTFSMVGLTDITDKFKKMEYMCKNDQIKELLHYFIEVKENLSHKIPLIHQEMERLAGYLKQQS